MADYEDCYNYVFVMYQLHLYKDVITCPQLWLRVQCLGLWRDMMMMVVVVEVIIIIITIIIFR